MEATGVKAGVKEAHELKIVRDPSVFLVGRQTIDRPAIDRFLGEHELTWQTDTEVGAEVLAEIAGRVCYMSYGKGRKTNREFLEHIVEVGHGSVLEHGVWSFLITGVSRSFTHELIRHRHFSYSQLSQRYVERVGVRLRRAGRDRRPIPRCTRCGARRSRRRGAPTTGWSEGLQKRYADIPEATLRAEARAPGGPLGAAQRHRDQDLRDRQRPGAAPLHRAARAASTPTSRSARSRWRCCASCSTEAPAMFGDYTLVPLAGGDVATRTAHPKV